MINVAPGTPQYSGNFVPELWSSKLLVKFYAACVQAAICNTDYEGEIKDVGDKVIIRTVPDIVIRNYVKNQNLQIQRPNSAPTEMTIDRAKYFNFICDDIDKHQTDIPLMDSWSRDASQQMKIVVGATAGNITTISLPNCTGSSPSEPEGSPGSSPSYGTM